MDNIYVNQMSMWIYCAGAIVDFRQAPALAAGAALPWSHEEHGREITWVASNQWLDVPVEYGIINGIISGIINGIWWLFTWDVSLCNQWIAAWRGHSFPASPWIYHMTWGLYHGITIHSASMTSGTVWEPGGWELQIQLHNQMSPDISK